MKNIHVLPTDKPSRLIFNSFHKSFCCQKEIDGMYINDGKVSGADFWGLQKALNNGFKPQNIYITSDEEIKDGDWCLYSTKEDTNNEKSLPIVCKITRIVNSKDGLLYEGSTGLVTQYPKKLSKIILTTDQDLINDGVQAINDEFLEWFVKNPGCEFVEIKKDRVVLDDVNYNFEIVTYTLKILIPKEEPKQETLEEVAIKYARWQEQRMYSEEEVLKFTQTMLMQYKFGNTDIEKMDLLKETFQLFKKK